MRFGGISGLLFVALLIPAYVVGTPDAPSSAALADEVVGYFSGNLPQFLALNGRLTLFSVFFFLWFLGILHGLLRSAEGEGPGLSSAVLAGGLMYVTLTSVGFAAEILYPATTARFEGFQPDAQLGFLLLTLSAWAYFFCQVGMSVLVGAASLIGLRTAALPAWLSWTGFAAAILALIQFLIPPYGGLPSLLWIVVLSILMLVGAVGGRKRSVAA